MALPAIAAIASAVGGVIKATAAIGAIMVTLFFIADWLKIFPDWLSVLLFAVLTAAGRMLKDLFFWILDNVLEFVVAILESLEFDFSLFNPAQYIGGMPADVVNVIGLIRVPEAIAIILAAIGIKVILQLIPFTRLGG